MKKFIVLLLTCLLVLNPLNVSAVEMIVSDIVTSSEKQGVVDVAFSIDESEKKVDHVVIQVWSETVFGDDAKTDVATPKDGLYTFQINSAEFKDDLGKYIWKAFIYYEDDPKAFVQSEDNSFVLEEVTVKEPVEDEKQEEEKQPEPPVSDEQVTSDQVTSDKDNVANNALKSNAAVSIQNIQVVNNKTSYTISADITGKVIYASFPTWTQKNGQDDLLWRDGSVKDGKVSYTVDMKDHNYEDGTYLSHIYVYDAAGNSTSAAVTPTTLEKEKMAIDNIQIANNGTNYTITADVSGSYINKISFPSWTAKNGQDDVIWKDGTINNGTVTYTVDMKDHNYEDGSYLTHIYVYNAAGQSKSAAVQPTTLEKEKMAIDNIQIAKNGTNYTITADVSGSYINKVSFPSWTAKNGQDDVIWKDGTINNGTVSYTVDMKDHNYEDGSYLTHIYVYNIAGQSKSAAVQPVTLEKEKMAIHNIQIANNGTNYTITADVSGSYINKVSFPSWTAKNGQDDVVWKDGTITNGTVSYTVDMKDHNYEDGSYLTHIYVYNAAGQSKSAAVQPTTLEKEKIAINNIQVANNGTTYTITADVSGSYITKASFPSWTVKNGQDDVVWKNGTITNGSVSYTVDMKDHNYEDGDYLSHIYVYNAIGQSKSAAIQSVSLQKEKIVIDNIQVVQNKTNYTITADVSGSYITKASFPSWTLRNGQDDVVWKDGNVGNGIVSYTVDMKDHNYEDGDYISHIYVYNALGQSKSAAINPVSLKKDPITIQNINVINNKSTYTITADVTGSYISRVAFPTWTEKNGQDDLIWRDGTISNGKISYTVLMKDHAYEDGNYLSHIYVYNASGAVKTAALTKQSLVNDAPIISNIFISDVTSSGYFISCEVNDDIGIKRVVFPVWTAKNGQDEIKFFEGKVEGSVASLRISIKDHRFEGGTYLTHVYAYDVGGKLTTKAAENTPVVTNLNIGLNTVDGETCFMNTNGTIATGFVDIGADVYYFDPATTWMLTGYHVVDARQYYFDGSGRIKQMTANIPYFSQRDYRWGNKLYGKWYFSGTGCAPTAAAMIFSFIRGYITPDAIGDWAYLYGYFNHGFGGSSDTFWVAFCSYLGKYCRGSLTMEQTIREMKRGRIVAAAMNPGTFTNAGSTHEIVLYGIDENNMVNVYDPYFPEHNGKYPISLIFAQLSTDPVDNRSGGPIFAIG